jgi:hypothetical protein
MREAFKPSCGLKVIAAWLGLAVAAGGRKLIRLFSSGTPAVVR